MMVSEEKPQWSLSFFPSCMYQSASRQVQIQSTCPITHNMWSDISSDRQTDRWTDGQTDSQTGVLSPCLLRPPSASGGVRWDAGFPHLWSWWPSSAPSRVAAATPPCWRWAPSASPHGVCSSARWWRGRRGGAPPSLPGSSPSPGGWPENSPQSLRSQTPPAGWFFLVLTLFFSCCSSIWMLVSFALSSSLAAWRAARVSGRSPFPLPPAPAPLDISTTVRFLIMYSLTSPGAEDAPEHTLFLKSGYPTILHLSFRSIFKFQINLLLSEILR